MHLSKFRQTLETVKNPTVCIEEITPELAATYLAKNCINRKISQGHVDNIASRIAKGDWELNGDTIRFDDSGNLIDGQHRLSAIIKAQIPVTTFVARGFGGDAFQTIDEGKPRGGADALSIVHGKHPRELASALRLVSSSGLSDDWGGWHKNHVNKISNKQMFQLAKDHPGCVDAVMRVMQADRKNCRKLLTASTAVFTYYWLVGIDPEDAEQFFDWLEYGEGITRNHPVMQLRNRLIGMLGGSRGNAMKREQIALVFKAWNACRTGVEVKLLRFSQTHNFPTPQ